MKRQGLKKKECKELMLRAVEYAKGDNMPKDTEKATQILMEAVEGYLKPEIGDVAEKAFKNELPLLGEMLAPAVKENNAYAFYLLWQLWPVREQFWGCCGIEEDVTVYNIIDKAAAFGSGEMKYTCGMSYLDDLKFGRQLKEFTGLEEEYVKAKVVRFMDEAAQLGWVEAQHLYFVLSMNWHVLDEDPLKGIHYLKAAAKNGHVKAQCNYGRLMLDSSQDEETHKEGMAWLEKAAKKGDTEAMFTIANIYSENPDDKSKAMNWYEKAAKKGDARAQWIIVCECDDGAYDMRDVVSELSSWQYSNDPVAEQMLEFMIAQPERFKKYHVRVSRIPGYDSLRISSWSDDAPEDDDFGSMSLGETNVYDLPADDEDAWDPDFDREYPSAAELNYEVVMLYKRKVIFTDLRIDRDTVPEGYYCYDIREDDGFSWKPCQVGNYVMVNHMGTVITNKPIELDKNGFRDINRRKREWKQTDEWITLEQYMKECPPAALENE